MNEQKKVIHKFHRENRKKKEENKISRYNFLPLHTKTKRKRKILLLTASLSFPYIFYYHYYYREVEDLFVKYVMRKIRLFEHIFRQSTANFIE